MAVLPSIPGGSSGSSQSSSSPVMIPGMMGVYNQLLGVNSQHYGNVLNAYQQGESNIAQQSPQIAAGYGNVNANVQNQLGMGQVLGQNGNWGVASPAAQNIASTFAQQQGQTTQQMTNAGLGNTTAVGNMQNQNALLAGQAYGNLGAQLAQTAAGYTAQEGNAALASRMQGLGMQSSLYGQALGPLGQQFANTAGALSGQSSTASSTQQALPQQQNPYNSQNGYGANTPGNAAAGVNSAAGGSTLPGFGGGGGGGGFFGGSGGLGGSGFSDSGGYNPTSAYGAQGGLGSSLVNGGYFGMSGPGGNVMTGSGFSGGTGAQAAPGFNEYGDLQPGYDSSGYPPEGMFGEGGQGGDVNPGAGFSGSAGATAPDAGSFVGSGGKTLRSPPPGYKGLIGVDGPTNRPYVLE